MTYLTLLVPEIEAIDEVIGVLCVEGPPWRRQRVTYLCTEGHFVLHLATIGFLQ
jgi:hypothetical protein